MIRLVSSTIKLKYYNLFSRKDWRPSLESIEYIYKLLVLSEVPAGAEYSPIISSTKLLKSKRKIYFENSSDFITIRLSVSPAQIVLKWLTVKGWSVLPKSSNPQHLRENINLGFDMDQKYIDKLSSLAS